MTAVERRATAAARPARTQPSRRRRDPDVRPEQILDAAVEVLLGKGLAATTMDDIASVAGIAKGTMYLYFDSKTKILATLRTRWVERMLVSCLAAANRSRTATTILRVQRFFEAMHGAVQADAQLLRILFREAGADDDHEMALVSAELLTIVREGIERGELQVRDPDVVVAFLVYGVHGVFAASLAGSLADRRRTITVTRRIVRALLEPATA